MTTKTKDGPDKGWSWIVAFAACFNSLILAGIFRTGGVLFVAFISNFGVTREEASWPMVLCISVLNLIGPVAGVLGEKFGVRPITMIGAVIGAVGISGCFFTTSLGVVNILFGVVFGIGYGLVNTLMPVIVNVYFLNLRATANGIANSGSCFGSLILPVFFEFLIGSYGLTGCFLLTGGVVLQVAVAGALLRPPSWLEKPKIVGDVEDTRERINETSYVRCSPQYNPVACNSRTQDQTCSYSCMAETEHIHQNLDGEEKTFLDPNSKNQQNLLSELNLTLRHRNKNKKSQKNNLTETRSLDNLENPSSEDSQRFIEAKIRSEDALLQSISDFENMLKSFSHTSLQLSPTEDSKTIAEMSLQKCENVSEDSCENTESDLNRYSHPSSNVQMSSEDSNNIDEEKDIGETLLSCPTLTDSAQHCPLLEEQVVRIRKCSGSSAKAKSQDLNRYSHPNLNAQKSSEDSNIDEEKDIRETLLSCPTLTDSAQHYPLLKEQVVRTRKCSESSLKSQETLNSTRACCERFDALRSFKVVLCNPLFYITAVTNVSFYFLFHMYVVIIIDYALDVNVAASKAKYILFAFSISDLFGRLCLGWVTDRGYLRRSHFVMLGMAAIGVVFFCFPFARSYGPLVAASCCYGLLLGCTMVIFPILLVDFLGTEAHAVAYGCMCFMNGFASFGRPFLIGYFRDNLGSYANIFYICGVISLVASLCWLFERCFLKEGQKRTGDSAA